MDGNNGDNCTFNESLSIVQNVTTMHSITRYG